jgi:predicted nucleic acid-binding Zn ribbon protein
MTLWHETEEARFPDWVEGGWVNRKPTWTSLCPVCEQFFTNDHPKRIYCSWRCSNRIRLRRNRARKKAAAA